MLWEWCKQWMFYIVSSVHSSKRLKGVIFHPNDKCDVHNVQFFVWRVSWKNIFISPDNNIGFLWAEINLCSNIFCNLLIEAFTCKLCWSGLGLVFHQASETSIILASGRGWMGVVVPLFVLIKISFAPVRLVYLFKAMTTLVPEMANCHQEKWILLQSLSK